MLDLIKLGANIQCYRTREQLTQAQLGEKLFVSFQAISNWERGITAPDLENLCKLSALLHVPVDRLLKGCEQDGACHLIGIDGGGTKTEFVLFSESGRVIRTLRLSATNPNDIGMEKSCEVLAKGIDTLLKAAPDVSGIFAGIAGSSTGNNEEQLASYLQNRYKNIRIFNDNDIVNVLASGGAPDARIALICGTGSVALVRSGGKNHLIGGWGYLFDEAGSAYDIGRDGIRAALAQQDGLEEKTLITELLGAVLSRKIRNALDEVYREGKAYIASFAPVVFTAYSLGDKVAASILRKNAAHLTNLLQCAQEQYNGGSTVVVGGGLFENYRDILIPMIQESLPSAATFIYPELRPVYGACVECCRRMNISLGDSFQTAFTESYSIHKEETVS